MSWNFGDRLETRQRNAIPIQPPNMCTHSHTPSDTPVPPDHMCAWILKVLSASGTLSITKHCAVRMTYPPSHPFEFCWIMCLLIPRIVRGACVLCSAWKYKEEFKWLSQLVQLLSQSHNGVSWFTVHLVNFLLLRLVLSLAAVMCIHICANGAWRKRLLEALVYQPSWSVIVIANGFSRGLATINRLGWNLNK